ncbi:hypothetical protein AAFF_G00228680 [Aldrovandia affinis]|uniref:Uncharacterized protein n=1 Tax=Aldrovandia affinis TaxID=143900 RepID=A0AAD7WU89_9TELE|nr:hypothetical protein AAFF_G00228680 [Aldrovandia affinis]
MLVVKGDGDAAEAAAAAPPCALHRAAGVSTLPADILLVFSRLLNHWAASSIAKPNRPVVESGAAFCDSIMAIVASHVCLLLLWPKSWYVLRTPIAFVR